MGLRLLTRYTSASRVIGDGFGFRASGADAERVLGGRAHVESLDDNALNEAFRAARREHPALFETPQSFDGGLGAAPLPPDPNATLNQRIRDAAWGARRPPLIASEPMAR